jgi:sugar lactone lactonase YvrE
MLALAGLAAMAVGCGDSSGDEVEMVASGEGVHEPTGLAFRPGAEGELWVTNHGDDSIAIVDDAGGEATVSNRRDAYAEHFVARPDGLAFDSRGEYVAVANDSNNEVRDMHFVMNPERNRFFKNNNFMGPTLFDASTYALAGQSKGYLDDWPQPGFGHDPPDDVPRHQCPAKYWSEEAANCIWPREGSHLDMLHGSPLAAGIVNLDSNLYFVLDGCGTRTATNKCRGDGHVVLVDFNRDHQEGNGFHGDGVIERFIDAPFTREEGVPSGIVEHQGEVFYADTGGGVVRRLDPDSGEREVAVGPWHPGPASHHLQGNGLTDWSDAAHGPPDGDDPRAVEDWVEDFGDTELIEELGRRWIKPQETLGEYVYVLGADGEEAVASGVAERPAGLAASDDRLYVADNANGEILAFSWDDFAQPQETIETGADSLGGLALDPADDGWLYFTDVGEDSVGRVALD